jgi:hypothetical protein
MIARRRVGLVLVACVLVLSACAQKRVATIANVAIFESLTTLQTTANALHETGQLSDTQRLALGEKLLPALRLGREIAQTTLAIPAGSPAPPELRALITAVNGLLDEVVALWADSPGKAAIVTQIAQVQRLVVNLLLAIGG